MQDVDTISNEAATCLMLLFTYLKRTESKLCMCDQDVMCACIVHSIICTCIGACAHTCMHAHMYAHMYTHLHTHICVCMHARMHTHTHTYTHTHTHFLHTHITLRQMHVHPCMHIVMYALCLQHSVCVNFLQVKVYSVTSGLLYF